MTDTISYSAWSKYHTCPRLYKLHYIDRVREERLSSPLVFGVAIDEAINALLLGVADPIEVFRENFTEELCRDVIWRDDDLDWDLFTPEQLGELQSRSNEYAAWASMRIKGRLLIESYINNFYPLIEEVHGVQIPTNRRKGFIDGVLTIRGHGKVLVDLKTSSRPYKRDAVGESYQLALYAEDYGIDKVGFVVLSKQLRKNKQKTCTKCGFDSSRSSHQSCPNIIDGTRCHGVLDIQMAPEAPCQILIEDVSEIQKQMITESIGETEQAISKGHFPANLSACNSMYGKPCPMYNYCRSGDMTGLIIKENESD